MKESNLFTIFLAVKNAESNWDSLYRRSCRYCSRIIAICMIDHAYIRKNLCMLDILSQSIRPLKFVVVLSPLHAIAHSCLFRGRLCRVGVPYYHIICVHFLVLYQMSEHLKPWTRTLSPCCGSFDIQIAYLTIAESPGLD